MSDAKQLIQRYCRTGDSAAFTGFYRQYADKLWRFLVARGSDPDTAYDLLSEAFLRFFQVVCKDPSLPGALLFRIAINLQIDHFRRRRPTAAVTEAAMADAAVPGPEAHAHVRRLVRTLPENEQNLLLMRYWIGFTHKEIAVVLEMPEGTVRRRCAAALHRLRDEWAAEEGQVVEAEA